MRPDTPAVETREALSRHVTGYADRIDGRLGVLVAVLRGVDDVDVVVSHRPERRYAAASVIKLPVLYALYREHDDDLSVLDQSHGLAPENRVGGSGVFHLLDAEPTLRDLATAMTTISDNAATNELIDHLGAAAVNDAAAELGMERTRLGRKLMTTLDGDGPAGEGGHDDPSNTTSPRDCARFFAELCHGGRLSSAARAAMLDALGHQTDVSMFARYLPYGTELAHKTGRLPDAALDAGVVDPGADAPLCFAVVVDRADDGGAATDVVAEIGDAVATWWAAGD